MRLQAFIDELPWHFVLAASGEDAIYLPKPWPKIGPDAWPLPHEILGLPSPTLLTGNPCATWLRQYPRFTPFAWDKDAVVWLKGLGLGYPPQLPLGELTLPSASLAEVARINGRRFSLLLESRLAEGGVDPGWNVAELAPWVVVSNAEGALEVLQELNRRDPALRRVMVKGEHGQSGSANLVVSLDAPDPKAQFLHAQRLIKRCGYAVVEPWHAIRTEYGYVYDLNRDGGIENARGHTLLTDANGQYLGVLVAPGGSLPAEVAQGFAGAATQVAKALHGLGYHGPVGQDGYTYFEPVAQGEKFRPLSDLNVRLTLAAPAHALSRQLGQYVACLLLSDLQKSADFIPAYDSRTRSGTLWASPLHDTWGRKCLRRTVVVVAESASTLKGELQKVFQSVQR
jgi:hypothetical protein